MTDHHDHDHEDIEEIEVNIEAEAPEPPVPPTPPSAPEPSEAPAAPTAKRQVRKVIRHESNSAGGADSRRAILEMVAKGDISPEEAAELLSALSDRSERGDQARAGEPAQWIPPSSSGGRAKSIRIKSALRSVFIEGDPSVSEAEPVGAHQAHREGDVLVISADSLPDFKGDKVVFAFSGGRGKKLRSPFGDRPSLRIRVNPDIPLDTEVDAGSIVINDVHSPIRVRVSAGSAKVTGLTESIDAQISAGSLFAQGRLDHGHSVISCDAGSVKFDLAKDSSVKVRARTSVGKIVLPGGSSSSGSGRFGLDDEQTATVGDGDGSLEITADLGKVVVRVDEGMTSSTSWEWRDR